MARMKFLCDADRCIECNACVTACKNEHEVPWGINRRRVVTINDGKPGERSVSATVASSGNLGSFCQKLKFGCIFILDQFQVAIWVCSAKIIGSVVK